MVGAEEEVQAMGGWQKKSLSEERIGPAVKRLRFRGEINWRPWPCWEWRGRCCWGGIERREGGGSFPLPGTC